MAVLVGTFTDKGREWFAKVLAGKLFNSDPMVFLRNDANGVAGNVLITDTVADTDFLVTGMANGNASTPPTGTIWCIAGSFLVDGETFTIDDGVNPAKVFEFDKDGIVIPGNVAVPVTNLMSASDVAVAVSNAINLVGTGLAITATFVTRSAGIQFFRIGEGGFQILPSTEKVPIAASSRKDKNGIQAGRGVKGDLTVDPDLAPAEDQITVSNIQVPDVNTALFFAQKFLQPADVVVSLVSGVWKIEFSCTLGLPEANKRYNAQGAGSPIFFELGVYAQEGANLFMIGYVTFAGQTKVNTASLTNKVVFNI